jgi:hypothetical protein
MDINKEDTSTDLDPDDEIDILANNLDEIIYSCFYIILF